MPCVGVICNLTYVFSDHWRSLETLELDCCPLTDDVVQSLSHFPALLALNVSDTKLTASGVANIFRSMPQLQEICMFGCAGVSDTALEPLSHGNISLSLTSANFEATGLTHRSMNFLAGSFHSLYIWHSSLIPSSSLLFPSRIVLVRMFDLDRGH